MVVPKTDRFILRLPKEVDRVPIQVFGERNIGHLSPWRAAAGEPKKDHRAQIIKWKQEFKEGKFIRFLLFLRNHPEDEIVGFCHFSQIFQGPFQSCYLGYHLDAAFQGMGLMSEAVAQATEYMFETQNLHRILANYMPSNQRSARLFHRLRFVVEGRVKKSLLINRRRENPILTFLTNEDGRAV